jgi:calreticulin
MAVRSGSSYAAAALLALASVASVAGEVFFQEKFEGDSLDPTTPFNGAI